MKTKLITIGIFLLSLFLLTSCRNKQTDLSGSYFYVQTNSMSDQSGNNNLLHKVVIKRLDKTNKNYELTEIGMYGNGNNRGSLTVDGDILNSDLDMPSQDLDIGLKGFGSGTSSDISDMKGLKFTLKNDVLSIGESNKVDFYKENTELGEKYQKIFLGDNTWHQLFNTPAPKELSQNNSNDTSETLAKTTEESELVISNVKYYPESGNMSLKVKNNSKKFIDSAIIYGTMKRHETNGYGEDETTSEEFNSTVYHSSYIGYHNLAAIGEDTPYAIYHIDKGEEKEFTFPLNVGDDPKIYSDPEIDTDMTRIIYREKEMVEPVLYQALDSDYELTTNSNSAGEIESVTIKNTSNYQWESVTLHHEYSQRYGDELKYTDATEKQIDIGKTVTIENLGGTTGNYGHATRIMYVAFSPRTTEEK